MSVIVVGGGAAGLTAAHFAARQGAQVCVLEKTREAGKKILLSGGTRCNVLPVTVDLERDYFTSSNPRAMQAVFRSWNLEACHDWLTEDLGLELEIEKSTGKYFPKSNSARDVRNALLDSCLDHCVNFEYNCSVKSVKRHKNRWECQTMDQRVFHADRVIFASGGKSYPKTGTDGIGYSILKKLGHALCEPYPALTPLLAPHPGNAQLAGISLKTVHVCARTQGTKTQTVNQRGGLLFTHRGFSGPSILDISHFVSQLEDPARAQISVNWSGEDSSVWESRLKDQTFKGTVANYVHRFGIPSRLASALCHHAQIPHDQTLSHLTREQRHRLVQLLTHFDLACVGHAGYRLAEVTGGGVPFSEISTSSMESLCAPDLFICGELMDIFGRIGGFNFYWAWVSGRLAGIQSAH